MKELYDLIKTFKYEKQEEMLEAICFLNQPMDDYVMEDYLKLKDLKNKYMQYDAFSDTYKRKSINDYENQRKRAIEKISSTNNMAEKISIAISEATEIREGIHGINYNEMIKPCFQVVFMMETCKNMMLQGATLTEISKYVPGSQMGDIYHFGVDHLGIKLELNEKEEAEINRYDEIQKRGNQNTVNLQDIMKWKFMEGIPHKQSDKLEWSIDGEVTYDTFTMACTYAECFLSFPYYYGDRTNPTYAKYFDEVLEQIMLNPEKITFDGLEKAYSLQEWNLLKCLQEKLLEKKKEK